jgi:beta-fructofuranosidase
MMMTEKEQRLIQEANEETIQHQHTVQSDPNRLSYHLMPPVGLLNDPNGFIQWNGTYHVFYQWMPFKTGHGAKFWGHYSSPDLVEWTHEKIALAPSEWYEKNGCYSGSAVNHDGMLTLFYTGNVKDENNHRETYQCMAVSENGLDFEKKGPVVQLPPGYTAHFRDPKVWKKDDAWYMIVGAQSEKLEGQAALLKSENLIDWEHVGAVAGSHIGELGSFGYMWECPDLFELDGQDVLIVCPQGLEAEGMLYQNVYQAGYFIGRLNYEQAQFQHENFVELDRGFEFYAPQTTLDEKGRRLLIAWMGVPEQDEDKHPTIPYKWVHAMTLPRELSIAGGKLRQKPVPELEKLRQNETVHSNVNVLGECRLEHVRGKTMELLLTDIMCQGNSFEVTFRNHARFVYNPNTETAMLKRKCFDGDGAETRQCKLGDLTSLHVYLDTSSIEIFVNEGEEVFTARLFPDAFDDDIVFTSDGLCEMNVKKWDLKAGLVHV